MDFVLFPTGGLPRIWRFTSGVLPSGTIATLNHQTNILVIDRELYDQLSKSEQHRLLRTRASEVIVETRTHAQKKEARYEAQ